MDDGKAFRCQLHHAALLPRVQQNAGWGVGVIVLAYGLPGTGKSTLLHDYVSLHAPTHRLFCMDHENGWGPDGIHWRGKPPKNLEVVEGEEGLERLAQRPVYEWPDTGVWVFQQLEGEAVAALALHIGDVAFVDDEIDVLARRKGWEGSSLRRIAHQGRHIINGEGESTQCHIVGACRRPQNLHTDVSDMADEVYVFRIQGRRTLERLLADSIIEDNLWETIRSLPDFHLYHWPSLAFKQLPSVGTPRDAQAQTAPPDDTETDEAELNPHP